MEQIDQFLDFIDEQDKEFLNLFKGKRIYCYQTKHIDDSQIIDGFIDDSPVVKRIGALSQDGKTLYLYRKGLVFFSQSFSPNHGVYQSSLIAEGKRLYIGIQYKNNRFFMWNTTNPDILFRTKPREIFLCDHHLFD